LPTHFARELRAAANGRHFEDDPIAAGGIGVDDARIAGRASRRSDHARPASPGVRHRAIESRGEPLTLRSPIAALLFVATSCAAPHPEIAPIPIDHAGFAGRLRRVCEMGKAAALEGACATDPIGDEDGWTEEGEDAGARDGVFGEASEWVEPLDAALDATSFQGR
jgi:hypothetical protein